MEEPASSTEYAIGFIGLGNMGRHMAGRLLDAGYRLYVNDVNTTILNEFKERGAIVAGSPAAVADEAEIIFCSLPMPEIVRDVTLGDRGIIAGKSVRIVVDLSTTGPRVSEEIGKALAAKAVHLVDAPVSGGTAGAAAGKLAIMVSGNPAAIERVHPLLERIGQKIFSVGEQPGQAQLVKLANNMLFATNVVAGLEIVAMGVRAGVDPAKMLAVINASSGRSFVSQERLDPLLLDRDFNVRFAAGLLYKDVKLGMVEAEAAGATLFVQGAVKQFLELAIKEGAGPEDYVALIRFFERWNGIEVRRKA